MATDTMTEATPRGRLDLEHLDPNKLGMFLFLVGEVVFFGSFIFAYGYFRGRQDDTGPTAGEALNTGLAAIFTVFLLASSGTIMLAERSQRAGNQRGTSLWLGATIALGVIFLIGQGFEWAELIAEGITVGNGLFGTTFFTLTGFHGFHVLGGLLMLTIILLGSLRGWLGGRHSSALESVSVYWHFVDIVWIVVFSVIYLWELLP